MGVAVRAVADIRVLVAGVVPVVKESVAENSVVDTVQEMMQVFDT